MCSQLVLLLGLCVWTARLAESYVTTDREVYEVPEFDPFGVNVTVDKSVTLPVTLTLIQETGNKLVTVKRVEISKRESALMIFANTTRNTAGVYMFAGYDKSKFQLKIFYLGDVHTSQSILDGSHVTYVECSAAGYPKPNVTWTRVHNDSCFPHSMTDYGGETVQDGDSFSVVSRKIRPRSAQSVLGQYFCNVTNGHKSKTRQILVHDPEMALALHPVVSLQALASGLLLTISVPASAQPSSAAVYQVSLSSALKNCPEHTTILRYPKLQTTFNGLCPSAAYGLKIVATVEDCSVFSRQIYDAQIHTLEAVTTVQAGTIASVILSALLGIVFIVLVCCRLVKRKQRKSTDFHFLGNRSASTWSVPLDRTSSVIELPDNSGYVAASDVTDSPDHAVHGSRRGSPVRSLRVSVESDYAVPYTPKQDTSLLTVPSPARDPVALRQKPGSAHRYSVPTFRQSTPSLYASTSPHTKARYMPRRAASVFLPDGSGYVAAGDGVRARDGRAVNFARGGLSGRRTAGRPLSLDIERARKVGNSGTGKSSSTGDQHVYESIAVEVSPDKRQRPASCI